MKNVFITGSTGFLGRYILKYVLEDKYAAPVVLARKSKGESAEDRIKNVLRYLYDDTLEYKDKLKRIKVIEGEIDVENFGLGIKTLKSLVKEIDEIYHSAAIAEFRVPLDKIRKTNVDGARRVFDFAMMCKSEGRLSRLNHISTTYLAGTTNGVFYETNLDIGQGFNNTYEQSKYEAELLLPGYRKAGLPVAIFRPAVLTGDSVTGKTSNFKMLYQPLHFFAHELFDAVPANRIAEENLIPVDIAAKEICLIANEKDSVNETFHIANPACVTAGHFVDVASDYFGFRKPAFVPVERFDMDTLTPVQKILIEPFIPYFNHNPSFDLAHTTKMLDRHGFICPVVDDRLLIRLFEFCAESGFIKPKRQYVATG